MTTSITKLSSYAQARAIIGQDPEAKVTPDQKADIIYRAACQLLGFRSDIPAFPVNEYTIPLVAHFKLQVIRNAITGCWRAPVDGSALRWYPLFLMNKPGFRFFVALRPHVFPRRLLALL
jgi:hypothetical protein